MRITDILVDRYGPLPRFSHQPEENLEVFYGPNESGKTLLLEAMLKLIEPDVNSAFPLVSRVNESPTGHVIVETQGTGHKLGNGTTIGDVTDLTPRHLRNIFVIRDSDLLLRNEHEFYDSVTQQIGDLHTDEIEAIQSRLVENGRLTSVGGRGLSSAGPKDDAEDVRDDAQSLAGEISAYLEEARSEDMSEVEREFIEVKTQLTQCETELERQDAAETLDTHSTLLERLNSYREAIREHNDQFSRDMLEELKDLDREIASSKEEIEQLVEKRESLREEQTTFESEKETVLAELQPLESREETVDEIDRKLDSYREAHGESIGASRGMKFSRYVALTGIILGGITAGFGSTVAGVLLAILGALGAGWYLIQHRAVKEAEQKRDELLQMARDAGLSVSDVGDIGVEIREYRDNLQTLQSRREELERASGVRKEQIEDLEDDLRSEREERQENQERKQELLQEVDVANVGEYQRQVSENEELDTKRQQAAQSLQDNLGTPPGGESELDSKIQYWETQLDELVSDLESDVTAGDYDPERHNQLQKEREELTERKNSLESQLADHDRKLREFDEQVQDLPTEPFIGESLRLSSQTIEGLQEVREDLEELVETIEREADLAREALDIFDDIRSEEEQKITDLFGPESRATEVFRAITEERYTDVTYDSGEKVLKVSRESGETFMPNQLSQGTTEQLYLSARIGLAEQLLGTEPSVFLMDDAFLPADRTRLENGFEILNRLAQEGWQILYFTAKDEVRKGIVEKFDLACHSFEPLV